MEGFFRIDKKLLSAEEIRGLIGELLFLKDVVTYDKDFNFGMARVERHDLENHISVEVKPLVLKTKYVK